MTFDPKQAAANLLALGFSRGEKVSADMISTILDCRLPAPTDTWEAGRHQALVRLNRMTLLRDALLERRVLAFPGKGGGLDLVARGEHIDRALDEMKKDVDKALRESAERIAGLDVEGLPNALIASQHDAAAYVDGLRRALKPNGRFRSRPRAVE